MCAWVFNDEVRRGEPVRWCPLPPRPGSSYCVFHHRRCYQQAELRELTQEILEDVQDAA